MERACVRVRIPSVLRKASFEGQLASLKRTGKGCCVNETDSLITLCSDWVDISFRRNDATIYSVLRKKDNRIIPLKDGPLPVGMQMKLVSLSARMEQRGDAVLCVRYRGGADSVVWRLCPDGLLKMDAVLLNRASGGGGFDDAFTDNAILNFGFTFSYPESECTGMRWLGRGPYRVWKNRIPGTNYGIWQKDFNNTVTGESADKLVYPEFKGYHANLYWATIQGKQNVFYRLCGYGRSCSFVYSRPDRTSVGVRMVSVQCRYFPGRGFFSFLVGYFPPFASLQTDKSATGPQTPRPGTTPYNEKRGWRG